jgi:hypothetical protein
MCLVPIKEYCKGRAGSGKYELFGRILESGISFGRKKCICIVNKIQL